jgi:feruloyl esterase
MPAGILSVSVFLLHLWPAAAIAQSATDSRQSRCAALPELMRDRWPDASTQLLTAMMVPAGPQRIGTMGGTTTIQLPEHCDVTARLRARQGALGQAFAIRFHLRMPATWNGRFYFQGGGGSNGDIGDALGNYPGAAAPALLQGFAVVSQDSGHDNRVNNDAGHAGQLVFGFDAEARSNYGHASLPLVADAARAIVTRYYGASPKYSYFVGCSKGGEEAMAVTQRYADRFDGVLAGAPAISLPRAAVAEAWDTQAFAAATSLESGAPMHAADLRLSFSDADLSLARKAVLAACDGADGLKDGIVSAYGKCTTARVSPQLQRLHCSATRGAECLNERQITALLRVMAGPRNAKGQALYSDWPWDVGIASPGWRMWKIGGASGQPPSLNVVLGGASLASVFTTPPTALPADPDALLRFLLQFDFDRDARKIYATAEGFPGSAWDAISARSSNLDAFRAHKGKLIVYHGVSDPVFSVNDSAAWWREVNQRYNGKAAETVRLFVVPGMNHCGGGEATDQFDALSSLMQWVEQAQAPETIIAKAGASTPWPGRERPLCSYPKTARYAGRGDSEKAGSFICK